MSHTVGLLIETLVAVLLVVTIAYSALALRDLRAPIVSPLAAVAGVFASTTAYRVALGHRERRLIKRAFQHYVAPAIVQQMLDDPSKLKIGGEIYEVTVLFSDLEGFTSVAEGLTPDELRA